MPMQCGSIFKGKHASQNLNRPNTTRVAYRTSEASFSPYPLSPWWWPNYGQRRQRLVCNGGAVHLCAIAQFEEARFFIESEFWRCDFLIYCRGHHRTGRIEQAIMSTARGTELGYTLLVLMLGPLLLVLVILSTVGIL